MMALQHWFPDLIRLEDHEGNWENYLSAIYQSFCADFIDVQIEFQGKRVGLKRHPVEAGKEATFWHFISEGSVEADRTPNIRRCERIGWPRAIIDNCDDPGLLIWTEMRGKDPRIHVWCESASYLLVLSDRGEYVLPWTAFHVEYEHERRKYRARYERFK